MTTSVHKLACKGAVSKVAVTFAEDVVSSAAAQVCYAYTVRVFRLCRMSSVVQTILLWWSSPKSRFELEVT